jgi:hypothetical protein
MSKPGYDVVMAALDRAGNRDLPRLIGGPGGYVLKARTVDGVEKHALWRMLLTETDHPMGAYLMTDERGDVSLLSGQLAAVAGLIRAEPGLQASPELPRTFWLLFRDQSRFTKVLDEPPPAVDRSGGDIVLRFAVSIDDEAEAWRVHIPASGEATCSAEKVAR